MGHKEELLAAARRCLVTRGYAKTTARDLVAESGTNLASIGYHFGSKDALLAQALDDAFIEYTDKVVGARRRVGPETTDPHRAVSTAWLAMTELTDSSGRCSWRSSRRWRRPSGATRCGPGSPRATRRCAGASSRRSSSMVPDLPARHRPRRGVVLRRHVRRLPRAVAARPRGDAERRRAPRGARRWR